ncbi:MAG: hypothetical protein JW934_04335 [Anaerolineae bacterium]|nr:hypothetical protein [Anaerolineae bacterium]
MDSWLSRQTQPTTIPFTLKDRSGQVTVRYGANTDPVKAGFDALPAFALDLKETLGYPCVHAIIEQYAGSGYRALCGWIQIVRDDWYDDVTEDAPPVKHAISIDLAPALASLNLPYACMGILPQFFDAPCKNIAQHAKLVWVADTFLTTVPIRSRQEPIRCLLGFQWGYIEYAKHLNRPVEILPLQVSDTRAWAHHLAFLRQHFPDWRFHPGQTEE